MQLLSVISGTLIGIYGLLNAFAGLSQLRAKEIQAWSAWFMVGFGVLLLISGGTLMMKLPFAFMLLAISLIAMHLLTIQNGFRLHGKINPGHHLLRLVISIILFGLAFWSLQ